MSATNKSRWTRLLDHGVSLRGAPTYRDCEMAIRR